MPSVRTGEGKILVNDSATQMTVIVIDPLSGKQDEVFIQAMSRARISPRLEVAPVSKLRNPRLKVIE